MKAGASARWFSYIAVGITIVSMVAGFALLAAVVYFLLHRYW